MAGPSDSQALLLTMSADTSKALKSLDALNAKLSGIEPQAKKAAKSIEDAFAQSRLGRASFAAGQEIGDNLRQLTSAAPAAGSALLALGPAGIAAAAGFGALALSLPKVREALDYVDELGDTAQKLHVSTTALQEYRFASVEAGGEAKNFDEAVEGLAGTLGKFQAGLAKGRTLKALQELGIDEASIAQARSIDELLPKIADKLAAVQSAAQRVALADAIGVRPLLPLLEQGSQKLDEFRSKAVQMGVVIDGQTVSSMADLQRQVEIASQRIDVNLKQAFLGLAPVLVQIANLAAGVASAISKVPLAMKGLQGGTPSGANRATADAAGRAQANTSLFGLPMLGSLVGRGYDALVARGKGIDLRDSVASFLATKPGEGRLPDDWTATLASNLKLPPGAAKGGKGAGSNPTAGLDKEAINALDAAEKAYSEAVLAGVRAAGRRVTVWNIWDKQAQEDAQADHEAAAQVAQVDADLAKSLDGIAEQERKVRAAKNDAHRAEQLNILAAARAKEIDTALTKKETIDTETATRKEVSAREAFTQALGEAAEAARDANATQVAQDQLSQQLARTTRDRLFYAQKLITDEKAAESAAIKDKYAQRLYGVTNARDLADISGQRDEELRNLDLRTTARRTAATFDNASPLEKWAREAPRTAAEISEAIESYAVKAFDDLNSGVAEAIANGEQLGDVLSKAFKQAEAAVISYLLKQAEIGVLSSLAGVPGLGFLGGLIPKFADGGLVGGAGGPRSDNILARLSPGEFVLSNRMIDQLTATSTPRAASAAPQYLSFDLRGAVMTEDLLLQMNRMAAQARAGALVDARQAIPAAAQARQRFILP